ncbi:DUF397 domain-containing protein [Sphaerisporangium sp. TRM90804]|uniref:DUF397 domain-containing protein n=1 Tax=Sphaerisporangium sp. TRM90804 TaxID=3031113 RepID=UPI00244CD442|nr:DUF397 domain-containing protein [Sphaerisporangium sp. TRM90804]MDH2425897.1 DUF397 domain-containing protein [Sphaerisporangium sp. TRM90804]
MDELTTAKWIKSSYSSDNGGNCVEIAVLSGGRVGVRDSKNPAGPALVLTGDAWHAFRGGVERGRFDVAM